MARSRIRNLDQGYRLCEHCGRQYHWSTFCTCQIRAEVEAIKAEAAERKAKRVVMVSDSNGQRYDREWFQREVIDARNADAAQPDQQYASLPKLTGKATVYNDWQTFVAACDEIDDYGMMGDHD